MGTIFFGSDYRVAEALSGAVNVSAVVTERRALAPEMASWCGVHGIPLRVIERRSELGVVLADLPEALLGVSCGFGYIFNGAEIAAFEQGIMNIHFGALPAIRGRHPLAWAFLLNHWEIGVSMHLVDERIDVGTLLHAFTVGRGLRDTTVDVQERIIRRLPAELPAAVKSLREGGGEPLPKGTYYDSLAGRFRDINAGEHPAIFIFNLFMAQKIYGPIHVDGVAYSECEFHHETMNAGPGWDVRLAGDGVAIALRKAP